VKCTVPLVAILLALGYSSDTKLKYFLFFRLERLMHGAFSLRLHVPFYGEQSCTTIGA